MMRIKSKKFKIFAIVFGVYLLFDSGFTRYHDYEASFFDVNNGKIEISLIGNYSEPKWFGKVVYRGSPYYVLVRFIGKSRLSGTVKLEDVALRNDEEKIRAQISLSGGTEKIKFGDGVYQAGIRSFKYDLEYIPYTISGRVVIRDSNGDILSDDRFNQVLQPATSTEFGTGLMDMLSSV